MNTERNKESMKLKELYYELINEKIENLQFQELNNYLQNIIVESNLLRDSKMNH